MQCEICGANIVGKSYHVRVDHSELEVCKNCARYGKEIIPSKNAQEVKKKKTRKRIVFTEEIIPEYGEIIRKEREKMGLNQEDFAKKINEKLSLIRKIEKNEMVPDEAVRKKIERFLGIKLTETINEERWEETSKIRGNLTLGDIVSIKRK